VSALLDQDLAGDTRWPWVDASTTGLGAGFQSIAAEAALADRDETLTWRCCLSAHSSESAQLVQFSIGGVEERFTGWQ
jgi:hypothetical protein